MATLEYSKAEERKIDKIQFGLLSGEEIVSLCRRRFVFFFVVLIDDFFFLSNILSPMIIRLMVASVRHEKIITWRVLGVFFVFFHAKNTLQTNFNAISCWKTTVAAVCRDKCRFVESNIRKHTRMVRRKGMVLPICEWALATGKADAKNQRSQNFLVFFFFFCDNKSVFSLGLIEKDFN